MAIFLYKITYSWKLSGHTENTAKYSCCDYNVKILLCTANYSAGIHQWMAECQTIIIIIIY